MHERNGHELLGRQLLLVRQQWLKVLLVDCVAVPLVLQYNTYDCMNR